MEQPTKPMDSQRELSLGRIALWLSPDDLKYLANHVAAMISHRRSSEIVVPTSDFERR